MGNAIRKKLTHVQLTLGPGSWRSLKGFGDFCDSRKDENEIVIGGWKKFTFVLWWQKVWQRCLLSNVGNRKCN